MHRVIASILIVALTPTILTAQTRRASNGNSSYGVMGPVYDIRAYGAICDGGSTDNWNAIQAAINDASKADPSSLGIVWIPPGPLCGVAATLTVPASPYQQVQIRGAFAKVHADHAGSGLLYTGAGGGDFIVIEDGSPSNYSYNSAIEDLYVGTTARLNALIHAYKLEGPARFDRLVLDGGHAAATGILCRECQFQVSINSTFVYGFTESGVKLEKGGPILMDNFQVYDIGQDPSGGNGVGIYADNVNGLTVSNSYFELMPVGIEFANDDEQYGQYDIHGNVFANWGSGLPGNPINTSHQRCILAKSTNNSYPFYAQGSIKHNNCRMGPFFSQGISPYAIEFNTANNAFYNSSQWEIEDNNVSGITTSAVFTDSPDASLIMRDNISIAFFSTGSVRPVPVPSISGAQKPGSQKALPVGKSKAIRPRIVPE